MKIPHHNYVSETMAQAAEFRLRARQAHLRNQAHLLKMSEMIACICRAPLGNFPGLLESDPVCMFEATDRLPRRGE